MTKLKTYEHLFVKDLNALNWYLYNAKTPGKEAKKKNAFLQPIHNQYITYYSVYEWVVPGRSARAAAD